MDNNFSEADAQDSLNMETLDNMPTYMPLRESVSLTLKKAILEGKLKPGQTVSENKIASKLSVSRTPVREAIRILEMQGLVTFLPGQRVVISMPTRRDVEEIYDIRMMAEAEALTRISPDQKQLIQELEKHIEEAERLRKEGKIREMGAANNLFHLTILSALDNQRMRQFIDSLQDTIAQLRFTSLTAEWAEQSEVEHKQIISCLKSGDTENAICLLHQNLTKPKEMLSAAFSEGGGIQPE